MNSEDTIMWHRPVIWNCWARWKSYCRQERATLMDRSRGIRMAAIRSRKLKSKSLSCKGNCKTLNPNLKLPVSKIKSSSSTCKRTKSKPMLKKPSVKPKKDSATSKETKPTNSELTANLTSIESFLCSMKPQPLSIKFPKTIWHN